MRIARYMRKSASYNIFNSLAGFSLCPQSPYAISLSGTSLASKLSTADTATSRLSPPSAETEPFRSSSVSKNSRRLHIQGATRPRRLPFHVPRGGDRRSLRTPIRILPSRSVARDLVRAQFGIKYTFGEGSYDISSLRQRRHGDSCADHRLRGHRRSSR